VRKTAVLLIASVLSGSLLLSACGGSAGATGTTKGGGSPSTSSQSPGSTSSPSSGSTTPNTLSTSTTFPYGSSHVVGKSTKPTSVPKEGPEAPVTQSEGAGQQILIEPDGFWPQTLYANMAVTVVWTNETSVPQKVVLDDIPVQSAEIPSGGQFVWSPHFGGSYTYHSASGFRARLILQQDTPVAVPPATTTATH
jgi:hypothetical protein